MARSKERQFYEYFMCCEATQEQIDKLRKLIDTIFPLEDEKTLYMTILATTLCGIPMEKFIVANGCGGNGKGVINELTAAMLGNYYYTCSNGILLNPLKTGPNPELANMKDKRMVVYREPDQSCLINIATFKELTGCGDINARLCNSNITKCTLKAKHILECNKRLKMNGTIDEAVLRRLIDILFRSTFTKNPDDFSGDYIFKGDDNVKSKSFQQEHKVAFFHILLDYWKGYLSKNKDIDAFICKSVKDRTSVYLQANDEVKEWFDTIYEKGTKEDYIQIKDVYERFSNSELFQNYSKKEKRDNSKKSFTEKIITNINFKKDFKDRHRPIIDGKQVEKRQVLMGWKPIKKEEIEPEENQDDCFF